MMLILFLVVQVCLGANPIQEATKIISVLRDYYSYDMLSAWMVEEIDEVLIGQFQNAIASNKKTFKIGVIGSSVAAGHDNCNYDSYERQLERLLKPVFDALEIEFAIQNAGEGGGCGDSHRNQVFCVNQNVSPEVDIVHYEWTYFEGKSGGYEQHESLLRWLQNNPRQPPLHIINVGGRRGIKCMKETLFAKYFKDYGLNGICLEYGLFKNPKYQGKQWGHIGDGSHFHTRYCETCEKDRKDSTGVVFRNWHPGPLGFQYLSDLLAFKYLTHLIMALNGVPSKRSRPSLPAPIICEERLCSTPPKCLNLEKPTFGTSQGINVFYGDYDLWVDTYGSNNLIPKLERRMFYKDPRVCSHLDHCGGIVPKPGSSVTFDIPKLVAGVVFLCGCCGKTVAESMFVENDSFKVFLDNQELEERTIWPEKKCVKVYDGSPRGSSRLKIMGNYLKISHIVTL